MSAEPHRWGGGGAGTYSCYGNAYLSDYTSRAAGDSTLGNRLPSVFAVGREQPLRSLKAAMRTGEAPLWKEAFETEVKRVFVDRKCAQLVTERHRDQMRAKYGKDAVITQFLVVPFKEERNAKGETTRRTARITYADTGEEGKSADSFSACLGSNTMRFMVALTSQLPGAEISANDVSGAYYHGTPLTPEEGGFIHYAEVPPGWEEFGYCQLDPQGRRNWFYICGNMPGQRDVGKIWEHLYTAFLLEYGF